jgi:hypothetical protein
MPSLNNQPYEDNALDCGYERTVFRRGKYSSFDGEINYRAEATNLASGLISVL